MDYDRDIELKSIQFKDVSSAYCVELGSADETVDDIKEKLRKEYPNGRHLKPQETLFYKDQELKDGHLLAEYNLPKFPSLYVVNLNEEDEKEEQEEEVEVEEEFPWNLGVIQSVKLKQLRPVDLLTVDEPFYNNPFVKPEEIDVFHPKFYPVTESQWSESENGREDEKIRFCNKRARMSTPPRVSNGICRGEVLQQASTRFEPAKKRPRLDVIFVD